MKRIIARILTIIMLATMFTFSVGATTSDIDGHWSQHYIEYLNSKKIILPSGVNFKPDQAISRAELMRYLNRAFNFSESSEIDFDDIKVDANGDFGWYYDDVKVAVKHQYINGTGNNNMSPLAYLNRNKQRQL